MKLMVEALISMHCYCFTPLIYHVLCISMYLATLEAVAML